MSAIGSNWIMKSPLSYMRILSWLVGCIREGIPALILGIREWANIGRWYQLLKFKPSQSRKELPVEQIEHSVPYNPINIYTSTNIWSFQLSGSVPHRPKKPSYFFLQHQPDFLGKNNNHSKIKLVSK